MRFAKVKHYFAEKTVSVHVRMRLIVEMIIFPVFYFDETIIVEAILLCSRVSNANAARQRAVE